MNKQELCNVAITATDKSYSPYSGCKVGAALLSADGQVFTGCNIENAAYSPGICAERTAVYKAISEGCRKIKAIAIVGDKTGDSISQYAFPCGVCRQVMREFSNPEEMIVIVAKSCEEYQLYTLNQLLPESFGPENLI